MQRNAIDIISNIYFQILTVANSCLQGMVGDGEAFKLLISVVFNLKSFSNFQYLDLSCLKRH